VPQIMAENERDAVYAASEIGFPLAMKVVGPLHKSDVGGVSLNVGNQEQVVDELRRLMAIPGTSAVLLSPMLSGMELFIGAKYEPGFGHLIFCGMGGVWLEVMKDVQTALAPVGRQEAKQLISRLKAYPLLQGYRGHQGINIDRFAELVAQVSALLVAVPQISELDLNPVLAGGDQFFPIDIRICLNKK